MLLDEAERIKQAEQAVVRLPWENEAEHRARLKLYAELLAENDREAEEDREHGR